MQATIYLHLSSVYISSINNLFLSNLSSIYIHLPPYVFSTICLPSIIYLHLPSIIYLSVCFLPSVIYLDLSSVCCLSMYASICIFLCTPFPPTPCRVHQDLETHTKMSGGTRPKLLVSQGPVFHITSLLGSRPTAHKQDPSPCGELDRHTCCHCL